MRQDWQDMHQLQELVRLHRLGERASQVAKRLGMDRKTERKYRRRIAAADLLEGPVEALPELAALRAAVTRRRSVPPQERSTVEAHRSFIEGKRGEGLGPTAIHGLLVDHYGLGAGSVSAVKRLYASLAKEAGIRPEDIAIPVHTAPGQQAQVDFGYVGKLRDPVTKRLRKAWVFVMTLSYSRLVYAKVVFTQDLPTWLQLHRDAFVAFGGVPAVVVPDNLKAAVIRAAFKADEMGTLNRSYRELARYYGFKIDPAPAYQPEKKGKVESAVKYVKNSFLGPRVADFSDVDDANARLATWLEDTANIRVHGTTGKRPQDLLEQVERPRLLGLPDTPYVPVCWHSAKVGRNSHVVFRGRFYSVPWTHAGKTAWLKVRGDAVTLYVDDARVADHRLTGDTPWSTVPGHLPEGRRDLAERDPETWFSRGRALHPDVETYLRSVMDSDEVHYPLRRVQSIARKLEALTSERAGSVARRAARFGCTRPDAVAAIIRDHLDEPGPAGAYVDPRWAVGGRFARQADEYLKATGATHASA
ncbi:MAG: IS21 family transposase [bacterium]|nr:IS21 family transposase [bacterium]